jgi:hypothetical protein
MKRLAARRHRDESNPEVTTAARMQRREPQLPHERDESSDNQSPLTESARRVVRQAARDVARGVVDTDLGPVLERIRAEHFTPPRRRGSKGG